MPEWSAEWLNVLWVIAAWPVANLIVNSIADRPRPGRIDPGPNWRMLVWTPAYRRWYRAEVKRLRERGAPVLRAVSPVCARCGLHHSPADWLSETCPYASRAVISDRLRVLGSRCDHCGAVHSLAGVNATQLCEDEQHGIVRGTE